MHTPADDLELAQRLADAADAAILPHFRNVAEVANKDAEGFDPVTAADTAAEVAMRDIIAQARPHDGVLGEEFQARASQNGRTWVLDPIDGTRAFVMGLPTWGVLIALYDGATPVLGLMSQPVVGDRFWGSPSGAFWRCNGKERPSACRKASVSEAILATTSPDLFEPESLARFRALQGRVRMTRYGTDCYAYALLAAGHVDIVMETGLKAVDIAPFVPMIHAAGGALTDLSGRPLGTDLVDSYNGEALAVANPAVLPEVLEIVTG
ncbi:MAG: inositol monophosphatase family protein [Devosia sp.]